MAMYAQCMDAGNACHALFDGCHILARCYSSDRPEVAESRFKGTSDRATQALLLWE